MIEILNKLIFICFLGAKSKVAKLIQQSIRSSKDSNFLEQDQSRNYELSSHEGQSESFVSSIASKTPRGRESQSYNSNAPRAQNSTEIFSPQFTSTQDLNSEREDEFLFTPPAPQRIQKRRVNSEQITESEIMTSTPIRRPTQDINNSESDVVQGTNESAVVQVQLINFP